MRYKVFTILFLLLFSPAIYSAVWYPDTAFNGNGKVSLEIGIRGNARDVLVQQDGKIIVVGVFERSQTDPFICLARFNPEGTLDKSFGTGGIVETNLGPTFENVNSAKLQPDGKIVIGGSVSFGSFYSFAVARYKSDGSLDPEFNGNGISIFSQEDRNVVQKIEILPDGKIVVAGFVVRNSNLEYSCVVARLNENGTVDTTFGSSGFVVSQVGFSESIANDLLVLSDGKLLVVGTASVSADQIKHYAIVRYNANGTHDSTFGQNGVVVSPIGFSPSEAHRILMQPDGKFLVAGRKYQGSDAILVRFNPDFSFDNSFANNGVFVHSTPETDVAGDILLQGNKILLGYYSEFPTETGDFTVVRIGSNGTLDLSFNQGIPLSVNFDGYDRLKKLKALDNGKIVAVGSLNDFRGFAVARITTKSRVNGRVISPNGMPIRYAVVHAFDLNGNGFQSISNPFGYFDFPEVDLGTTLNIQAHSKSFMFRPQDLLVNEEIENVTIASFP